MESKTLIFLSLILPIILLLCTKIFLVFITKTNEQTKNTLSSGKTSIRTTQSILKLSIIPITFSRVRLFCFILSSHLTSLFSGVKLTRGSAFLFPNFKKRSQNSQARDVPLSSSEASQTNRQERAAIHGTNK